MLTQFEGIADRVTKRWSERSDHPDLRQEALIAIWLALEKGIVNERWLMVIAKRAVIESFRSRLGRNGHRHKPFRALTDRHEAILVDVKAMASAKLIELRDADRDHLKLDAVIRAHCCRVLNICNGNRTEAAKVLGIGRATAFRWFVDWQRMSAGDGA